MIQIENASYSYGAEFPPALENATLSISRGSFAALVGPNGGGKSTLVRIILGLLKPQTGVVKLFGESPEKTRRRVGYAPQQAKIDYRFPISVMDVALAGRFGVGARGRNSFFFRFGRRDKERALAALEKMGVADLRRRAFGELSGGQRQRVLIARALCCDPELLVFDEPTNNVDPASAEEFYATLAELSARASILLATHDLSAARRLTDRVVCVNRRVRAMEPKDFSDELVGKLYAGDASFFSSDVSGDGAR